MLLPLAVQSRIEKKVGVLQIVGDFSRSGKDLSEACQQLLLRRGQGMSLPADELIHLKTVGRQAVIAGDGFQFTGWKREDLRDCKRGLGDGSNVFAVDPCIHALGGLAPGVLTAAQIGVAEQVRQQPVQLCVEVHEFPDRRGIRQLPLIGSGLLDPILQGHECGLPVFIGFIK